MTLKRGVKKINFVFLTGRLVQDPVCEYGRNSTAYVRNTIALDEMANGELETVFIEFSCFGKTAENMAKFCYKGRQIAIQGRLISDEWQIQNGEKRRKLKVSAYKVEWFGSKPTEKDPDIANSGARPMDLNVDRYGRKGDNPGWFDVPEDVPF